MFQPEDEHAYAHPVLAAGARWRAAEMKSSVKKMKLMNAINSGEGSR
jgi:hypothetical protein